MKAGNHILHQAFICLVSTSLKYNSKFLGVSRERSMFFAQFATKKEQVQAEL